MQLVYEHLWHAGVGFGLYLLVGTDQIIAKIGNSRGGATRIVDSRSILEPWCRGAVSLVRQIHIGSVWLIKPFPNSNSSLDSRVWVSYPPQACSVAILEIQVVLAAAESTELRTRLYGKPLRLLPTGSM
jgi:hypothetical protein